MLRPGIRRIPAVALSAAVITIAVVWVLQMSTNGSALAAASDVVSLTPGSTIALTTPTFLQKGRRYAFTWAGGGPPQTYTVKEVRPDGWVLVDVADENVNPAYLAPNEFPTRWLHVGIAVSIQEMRPLP